MTFPENFESKIGFQAVRNGITRHCISPLGSERVESMNFTTNFSEVEFRLSATEEMRSLIASSDEVPLGKIRDIRNILSHIRIAGTWATAAQVTELRKTLECMAEIRRFFTSKASEQNTYSVSALLTIVEPLEEFPELIRLIDKVVDTLGNIRDTASPRLAEIRSQLRSLTGSIAATLRRVLAKAVAEGYVEQDVTPTMRDGRLVIPVSPMYKRKIQGIVHDESATGKTVFIEPAEIVETNNRQRTLQIEEHREEIKVLTDLADALRPHLPRLEPSLNIVGDIDFIHAKALYAIDIDGQLPYLSDQCELEWYHACHPGLLESLKASGRKIVPLEINLTPEKRILIISGPNAGGKSVCLKTVGIVQYMGQCGVLPPIHNNSHFGIFSDIFVDIGDDQSIEDDLSTYSSHLRNMKEIVKRGNKRSLVLIDEFGGGTEPQIGGAIAQAILIKMNESGMWGVITTHYQNLKQVAEETPGLVNGSMLYDRHLMQPLFRLSIGNPGSSFALEIARKIGLPAEIINNAQEIVGSDYVNLDKYLLDIARDKRYWENKRLSIKQKEKQIDDVLQRYEQDAETLREKRREILSEAKEEARKIVSGTNAAIERTILEIRQSQAEREQTLAARKALKQELDTLTSEENIDATADPILKKKANRKGKNRDSKRAAASAKQPELKPQLEVGGHVRLDGQSTVGTILSLDKNKAVVSFGNLKTTVAIDKLKPTTAAIKSEGKGVAFISQSDDQRNRQLNFKQEIDVRGMRADEALQATTYFLDDAIQFNIGRVRILHGTGTGALRQAIRSYLGSVPQVKSFHDEDVRFGGAGITVINLD